MNNFSWKITHFSKKNRSRTGVIKTPHGDIKTPAFIFCATKASLKTFSTSEAKKNNTQIILSNTYHLMLQPGEKVIANHGGLHRFMNWEGPMLTDSGGFQIFSLGHGSVSDEIKGKSSNIKRKKTLINISEEGTLFKSYINGNNYLLTPERSIQIQRDLGADLILVFDECTPYHVDKLYTEKAMLRSHRWAKRSMNSFEAKTKYTSKKGSSGFQQIYGIVQGGVYEDLREKSIDFNLNNINPFGIAIGGSLGSTKDQMHSIVNFTTSKLGIKSPIHLLGIGDPNDIWNLVKCGIDTFDCVNPTRIARHGTALKRGIKNNINLKNSKYENKIEPIDDKCKCDTCNKFTLSYLHHLFKSKELLALQLVTSHNIFFMNSLMQHIRSAIKNDNVDEAYKLWSS